VEIETGKSDIKANLAKVQEGGFDKVVLIATSPAAAGACQKAITNSKGLAGAELMTWLDLQASRSVRYLRIFDLAFAAVGDGGARGVPRGQTGWQAASCGSW